MKKHLLLPLALSAAALIAASCSAPASSSSSQASSSGAASSEPATTSSVVEESSEEEYIPNYDYVKTYEAPAGWDVKGVEGGKTAATSLVGESVANKTKILGALEKYAIDNKITGMPLFENGGYVMYNERVAKGTENYITGYGFGIIREGKLTKDLTTAGVEKPSYYHTYEPNDPQKINYLDDSGSQIGDLYGNCAAGYFGTKANTAEGKYDWYGYLSSKDRPVMLDKDGKVAADQESGTSAKWRIYVRTGEDGGVCYRTASKDASRAAFDKKAVALKDYVDAFKILLCGKFAYYRGSELAGQTGYSGIVGAADYFNASAKAGFGAEASEKAWQGVGIKSGTDDEGDYLDFTLMAATSRFYAMYSLASNLYAPINLDFFKLVTNDYENPEFYGAYNTDKSMSPVDNFLSTGPYFLESWETDKAIAFARNDEWWERKEDSNVYNIPGIYSTILTAVNTDSNAAFKEFLLGNLDAASIPTDYLKTFKNDPRTTSVPGDSVFKLNLNTCTKDQWVKLFGKEGTITQTPESEYWDVKPWMSNDDFVSGLFLSIDRETFATNQGSIPSINYFSSNYMSDPEGGVSYNTTDEHAAAQADFWGSTVSTGGYSKELAQAKFSAAVTKMIADKTIKAGDELSIDVWWMYQQHITRYHEEIAKYIQDAFNASEAAQANKVTLKVNGKAVDVWSDVYYKHLMVGQFDLGFGSISGNSLDPLNFMEVLKSDNSSGFTLNWGPDTSAIDLDFNGEKWSFDNLWAAADHGVVTYKGQALPAIVVSYGKSEFDEEGNLVVTFSYQTAKAYMAELAAKGDADAKILADLDDEVFSSQLEYAYITDGVSIELGWGFEDGEFGALDDYEGYAEAVLAEGGDEEAGTITATLSYDLLCILGNEEPVFAFYAGAYGSSTVDGNSGVTDSYGAIMVADTAAA